MYCYFCEKSKQSVQRRYYKWSNFRLNSCDVCDTKYRDSPISICQCCGNHALNYCVDFIKDRGKSYYCKNCIPKFHNCFCCGARLDYDIANFVGKYVVCNLCCKGQGYWNALDSIDDSENTILPTNRKFGIEVEVYSCPKYAEAPKDWSCVHEGTETVCREFTSVPMRGDKAVFSLKRFCDFARANNWLVNERCGLHLHLDCTDLDEPTLVRILYGYAMTYTSWCSMVDKHRANNRFCRSFHASIYDDLMHKPNRIPDSVFRQRYYWLSYESLLKHNTIESRIHEGTINFNKIFYWLSANLTFMEWCVKQLSIDTMAHYFSQTGDTGFWNILGKKVTRYYKAKKGKNNTTTITSNVSVRPLNFRDLVENLLNNAPRTDWVVYDSLSTGDTNLQCVDSNDRVS